MSYNPSDTQPQQKRSRFQPIQPQPPSQPQPQTQGQLPPGLSQNPIGHFSTPSYSAQPQHSFTNPTSQYHQLPHQNIQTNQPYEQPSQSIHTQATSYHAPHSNSSYSSSSSQGRSRFGSTNTQPTDHDQGATLSKPSRFASLPASQTSGLKQSPVDSSSQSSMNAKTSHMNNYPNEPSNASTQDFLSPPPSFMMQTSVLNSSFAGSNVSSHLRESAVHPGPKSFPNHLQSHQHHSTDTDQHKYHQSQQQYQQQQHQQQHQQYQHQQHPHPNAYQQHQPQTDPFMNQYQHQQHYAAPASSYTGDEAIFCSVDGAIVGFLQSSPFGSDPIFTDAPVPMEEFLPISVPSADASHALQSIFSYISQISTKALLNASPVPFPILFPLESSTWQSQQSQQQQPQHPHHPHQPQQSQQTPRSRWSTVNSLETQLLALISRISTCTIKADGLIQVVSQTDSQESNEALSLKQIISPVREIARNYCDPLSISKFCSIISDQSAAFLQHQQEDFAENAGNMAKPDFNTSVWHHRRLFLVLILHDYLLNIGLALRKQQQQQQQQQEENQTELTPPYMPQLLSFLPFLPQILQQSMLLQPLVTQIKITRMTDVWLRNCFFLHQHIRFLQQYANMKPKIYSTSYELFSRSSSAFMQFQLKSLDGSGESTSTSTSTSASASTSNEALQPTTSKVFARLYEQRMTDRAEFEKILHKNDHKLVESDKLVESVTSMPFPFFPQTTFSPHVFLPTTSLAHLSAPYVTALFTTLGQRRLRCDGFIEYSVDQKPLETSTRDSDKDSHHSQYQVDESPILSRNIVSKETVPESETEKTQKSQVESTLRLPFSPFSVPSQCDYGVLSSPQEQLPPKNNTNILPLNISVEKLMASFNQDIEQMQQEEKKFEKVRKFLIQKERAGGSSNYKTVRPPPLHAGSTTPTFSSARRP